VTEGDLRSRVEQHLQFIYPALSGDGLVDDVLSTLGLERATLQPGPLARDYLDRWLAALARGAFGDVVRAKGIVRVDNDTLLVDVVMGGVEVRTFRPTPARFEIIGRNLDPRSMEKSLANGNTHIPSPSLTQ